MINNVVLMGRLVADPEMRSTQSGVTCCRFTLAIERDYKSGDERQTDFIPCVAWRQTAEFIGKYFGKGRMIAVIGAVESNKYVDKDGNNRTAYDVLVARASFCGEKAVEQTAAAPAEQADDELPFGPEELPF